MPPPSLRSHSPTPEDMAFLLGAVARPRTLLTCSPHKLGLSANHLPTPSWTCGTQLGYETHRKGKPLSLWRLLLGPAWSEGWDWGSGLSRHRLLLLRVPEDLGDRRGCWELRSPRTGGAILCRSSLCPSEALPPLSILLCVLDSNLYIPHLQRPSLLASLRAQPRRGTSQELESGERGHSPYPPPSLPWGPALYTPTGQWFSLSSSHFRKPLPALPLKA